MNINSEPSTTPDAKTIKFNCPMDGHNEEGFETIDIDNEGSKLDVYYLAIYPTKLQGDFCKASPAVGFPLKSVGNTEGLLLCVGHRGMGKEMEDQPVEKRWPENTILSFLKAAQLGIPMVELDVIPVRESEDLVLFHNFNVIKKKVASKQECCGSSKHEIDLFAETGICNKSMINLIPTFSPDEIKEFAYGEHSKTCKYVTKNSEATVNLIKSQEITLQRVSDYSEYFPFFSEVLNVVPNTLAFDVELKYPSETPYSAFRLLHEFNVSAEKLAEFGHPSRYFYPINQFADLVIKMLNTKGRGRAVILSTFNPDLCLALKLKQSTYPVFFISRCGVEQDLSFPIEELPPPPHSLDPRHRNATTAIQWAHLIGADGVVLRGKSLLGEKGVYLASKLKEYRLACIPYGPCVSTPEFKKRAEELGITGICIDDVEHNRW